MSGLIYRDDLQDTSQNCPILRI